MYDNDVDDNDTGKSSGPGLGTICATCVGAFCSCCCCLASLAIIVLLFAIGPVGWTIMAVAVAVFVIVFLLVYCLHQFVIEGTHFTIINYFLPFVKYGLVSQFRGEQGVKDFWKAMEGDRKYVAEGIGPNTVTYFGWQEAASMLSSWGSRLRNGTMVRHNELGTALMGPGPWPETDGRILLAFNRDEHALVRPIVAGATDGSKVGENVMCDGSNGWNRAWLRAFWREKLNSTDSFNTKDTNWWCTQIIHKIQLNMDLSDEDAQAFMNFPSCLSFPGFGKFGVGMGNLTDRELCLIKYFTPLPCFQCKQMRHMDDIRDALEEKWPDAQWDEQQRTLIAEAFCTSVMYAGGLSVPTILQNMLAWWYSDDRPQDLNRVRANDEDSIADFMWETIRRNPPVAGVPRWISDDGGETWNHEVANIEQAMGDERVFPNPMKFKMGRPGLNATDYSRSMAWADHAIVNNDTCHPDSHLCPGKQLTMDMLIAFWQEFLLQEWDTDATGISVGYNLTSTFVLNKL